MSRIKNGESVAPYYGQRVERAMRCRHGLSHTERQVLVVLAMRCEKAKPTEGDPSVDYIAQIAGYSPRCVNNALKVLVAKKLIRRVIAGAYDERRRTIMDWNLIQREPFVYLPRPSKANLKAQDEALESFENVPPTDTEMEDSETDMAEMAEVHDILAVRPETAKQPKTQATPKTRAKLVFDDSHLDIEEPVKENTLTEIAKKALDVLLPRAQRFGAVYPFIEVNGEAWFSDELAAKFKEYGLVATLVTVKIEDEQRPSVECVRIALPFPEYVAKRLSEHTGREVTPRETGNFTRFETGPHPYFALEYGLATESWCTMLKKADAPAGLLFRCFERIRQGWLDEGGYFYPAPQPETEANAEQATQDASEEEMPTA